MFSVGLAQAVTMLQCVRSKGIVQTSKKILGI
jgi:hypothetical protein